MENQGENLRHSHAISLHLVTVSRVVQCFLFSDNFVFICLLLLFGSICFGDWVKIKNGDATSKASNKRIWMRGENYGALTFRKINFTRFQGERTGRKRRFF